MSIDRILKKVVGEETTQMQLENRSYSTPMIDPSGIGEVSQRTRPLEISITAKKDSQGANVSQSYKVS